ncbi:helix-turn-helix transcriptional regulator [Nocardia xishanensis]|uniref:Helix-turn-helix transcriptional regulator n=1 Tax=Nocardia xishanensis TaxID=238964 RepID=A0ABW7X7V3_9NOCA
MPLHRSDLGEFLQSRRARLRPQDVGLPSYDEQRRVPGLRREELAELAGVSASYYARLEQGQSFNASAEVLSALARALRLDDHEYEHLRDLADARSRGRNTPPAIERPRPAMRSLMAALGDVPAVLTGRRGDILAWNRLGHALFAGHLDLDAPDHPARRPNIARLIFLDELTRSLYADWHDKARSVVEHLRLMAGRHPRDPLMAGLIGELAIQSREFATLWADYRVHACDTTTYHLQHPVVGAITVTQQSLTLTAAPDQFLALATTEVGSSSEGAMVMLAQLTR